MGGFKVNVNIIFCEENKKLVDANIDAINLLWKEYETVVAQAFKEYEKVRAPAWKEYEKVECKAYKHYHKEVIKILKKSEDSK
jgi:hypothetical protein